jgi:hypothetical protein
MSQKNKQLSNAFSTGGGGAHFEAHVQATFVTLMLTSGYAPCLPCWPIVEIKLQGKIDGFDTDDLIVIVEKPRSKERRKLLGQVKHSINITKKDKIFGEVIQAAWNDFNNPNVFVNGKDIIALITGPISATDDHNVQWLLNQARHTKNVDDFFRNVEQANFSPSKSSEKLEVIRHHLKAANGDTEVSKNELYRFLNSFQLLGYDLGKEFGVVLSLLHSHISQFQQQNPQWVWSRAVDIVQSWNQDAGTITPAKLPEDFLEAFQQRAVVKMPDKFKTVQDIQKTDWANHLDATYLALAILVGAWNEKNKNDIETIIQLFPIDYATWLQKAREILRCPDSPLSLKNGYWQVVNRIELLSLLGSLILDQDLDTFKKIALSVLKEPDPAFELPTDERYAANIHGKVLSHSHALRKGIADGLAILGNHPEACSHCTQGKAGEICILTIRETLNTANWVLWGSLDNLLPTLAEAAPSGFLDAVEKSLSLTPCPFAKLFTQESNGITGNNYLTGLLWALEGLAWEEQYLVRVCMVLGELANLDPGGQSSNRPSKSLATILLPWLPQTLATIEKRLVAVQTILKEWPDIGWNLLLQLLPGQQQTSFGSHKPSWRKIIPDNWDESVTQQEYWQQASVYAEHAVDVAGYDISRLSELIEHFSHLPKSAFDRLIDVLSSTTISSLPEDQRLLIWTKLTNFARKHRRFADAKWALSAELLTSIENIAEKLAPKNPSNFYKHLFTDCDSDLYEENGNWKKQQKELDTQRETAISKIFQQDGIDGIITFSETVLSPSKVGQALGTMTDLSIEQTLLPLFLDSKNKNHRALVSGFTWRKHALNGWEWCDQIDKSEWTPKQLGSFLAYLPFSKETWERTTLWLKEQENEYWSTTSANAYQSEDSLDIAIEKLLKHGRPHAAIGCLDTQLSSKQSINVKQCVSALLMAVSSTEPAYSIDRYHILELIKYLQAEPMVAQEDLFKIEWAYLPLLESPEGVTPKHLNNRLANQPEFFCEVIRIIYRSTKESQAPNKSSEKTKALAKNAWLLLHKWQTPPGTREGGTFDPEHFKNWLQQVQAICSKTGHLEVALNKIGEVLIHAPADPDGLWLHREVAEALNNRDAEKMRNGFEVGFFNSRGVYEIDPNGKEERTLAEQYLSKANQVENAGYGRLANILKELANSYHKEAARVVSEYL